MSLIRTFNRDGFILLKNFFSKQESSFLVSEAKKLYELPEVRDSYMKFYEKTPNSRILARMEYFLGARKDLNNLVETRVNPLVNEIMNENMIIFKDKINWKLPGGGAFLPHQDQDAWSDFPPKFYVTAAMFADKSTSKNGCLEFVEGVHNNGLLENNNGEIVENLVKEMDWTKVETTPRDIVLFDSYAPHRSQANKSDNQRRIYYMTYNKEIDGNFYEDYFAKKRKEFPPDFEREEGQTFNKKSKYNLANPID